ncbi:MAG: hypothetical protein ABIT37_22615 [Luteolibacter sp.]
MRKLLLLPAAGIFLTLSSCKDESSAPPPPVVINTEPVGNGLSVIGFAMLGAAVVIVLGKLLK